MISTLRNPSTTWPAAVAETVGSTNSVVTRSTHDTRVYSHLAPLPPPPLFFRKWDFSSPPITSRSLVPLSRVRRTQWSHFRISPVPQGHGYIRTCYVCARFFFFFVRPLFVSDTRAASDLSASRHRPDRSCVVRCRLISKELVVFSVLVQYLRKTCTRSYFAAEPPPAEYTTAPTPITGFRRFFFC